MADSFADSITAQLMDITRKMMLDAKIGNAESEVLELFYNEKYKVRRDKVSKFHIYGRLCDGKLEDSWPRIMNKVDKAILNLKTAGYIQDAQSSLVGSDARNYVGKAAEQYELTADGLERLQRVHPRVALRLRGWIAVMPPWLVVIGTIASGISASWALARLFMMIADV